MIFNFSNFFVDRYFGYYMPTTFYDMNDYDKPIKFTWRVEYQLIDINMMKRIKAFIKRSEFLDDKGFLFDETIQTDSFTYDFSKKDLVLKQGRTSMFEIFLYSSAFVQRKFSKFQKALEVLAAIGGQASFLIIFGFILTGLSNYIEFTSKFVYILTSSSKAEQKRIRKQATIKKQKSRVLKRNDSADENDRQPPSKKTKRKNNILNHKLVRTRMFLEILTPQQANQRFYLGIV